MRELILQMMVSVDGMAEGPGGNLDWIEVDDADLDLYLAELMDSVTAQIFGRVSYELLGQYWPDAERNPTTPGDKMLAPKVNGLPKLVVSRQEPELPWQPATRIGGDLAEEIAALKDQPGRPLILFAGIGTAQEFIRLNLIDEYRLLVFPVVLGGGRALFAGDDLRRDLRLMETVPFQKSGVVLHRYRVR
ncbi:dihydrofolate reductase family protein [Nocardia goodfellowii]|uniref:Dihydrofolate reductase n=1 Tax=Nocardia goodfellowii TaxID=882446 RepID=A0ABS4QLG1_9NOCA|nr:dihydrofolate reductase family protein [Nocardia goodfellowii]MBP2192546.1 dihydrofolate reductase [Nocardia goodfellowii]